MTDERINASGRVAREAIWTERRVGRGGTDRCGGNRGMYGSGLWTGRARWRGSGSRHRDLGDIP